MEFSDRLRKVIDKEGVAKKRFSEQCGVHRNVLHGWLSGKCEPSMKALRAIKKAYPWINLEWLVTGKGRPGFSLIKKKRAKKR